MSNNNAPSHPVALGPTCLALLGLLIGGCTQPSSQPGTQGDGEQTAERQPVSSLDFEDEATAPISATSLRGEPLRRGPLEPAMVEKQQALLEQARADLEDNPGDVSAWIWVGRRLAYLGRYDEALDHYSRAIERFPNEPRLYRHRGHRYLTVRRLAEAVRDLEKAAELTLGQPDITEPDGLPNAAGIETSTLQTNIYYHLGLAHYLERQWDVAWAAYERCFERAKNDDMEIATRYWGYLTLRRAGRDDDAAALIADMPAEMELLESGDYHRLLRLFRGDITEDGLLAAAREDGWIAGGTVGYGVAMSRLLAGDEEGAVELFRDVTSQPNWSPFGFLAAEAELAALDL